MMKRTGGAGEHLKALKAGLRGRKDVTSMGRT